MINLVSTYRIQFNKDFTFKHLKSALPYLRQLGIKTIYASPIYKAVPGSNHGYDVTDPNQINPEIGTLQELRALSKMLKSFEMYWIQDIVPNHMGFHHDNEWLMDVLKNGEASAYRNHFDLVTQNLEEEPLMVPFLGADLDEVIRNKELQLVEQKNELYLQYFDSRWPVKAEQNKSGELNIKDLVNHQYYRLCNYRETNLNINYRRFFTVNSLICLNMQLEQVFNDYHQLTKQLLDEGIFQGLRIDHVDGLANPTAYLQRLRKLCGQEVYIVVEKILEPNEELPKNWPIQGSTGYDYLGLANQWFTNGASKDAFDQTYQHFAGKQADVGKQILEKKKNFLDQHMQGELENLTRLTLQHWKGKKAPQKNVLKELIGSVLVNLPVYRLYADGGKLAEDQLEIFNHMFEQLAQKSAFKEILADFKTLLFSTNHATPQEISYFDRIMQFTGPLMAKGVEDTLMYTYHRFIGNNEVGDSPVHFGINTDDFHEQLRKRAQQWPLCMNTTATHDTKRAEDCRARLSVITDFAPEWTEKVKEWSALNQHLKTQEMPDDNDEYFIYQSLLSTCPEAAPNEDQYPERLLAYLEKALRESKRRSNWDHPNTEYEEATQRFVLQLIDQKGKFWNVFQPYLQKIAKIGKRNSLAALVLKHTLPGIPDTYQGTEYFDFSMVDPDNRRAVDYQKRQQSLKNLAKVDVRKAIEQDAITDDTKIQLLQHLLDLREQHAELFAKGNYEPVTTNNTAQTKVIAYTRQYQAQWMMVVVAQVSQTTQGDVNQTTLTLPAALREKGVQITNLLKPNSKNKDGFKFYEAGEIAVEKILDGLPFAIYHFVTPVKKRGAGVLMHFTSLPNRYGIGDLGPSAHQFLQYLANLGMKYWQVLPTNPISEAQSFSPYSSTSAMAGNILLISPEELANCGLLSQQDLTAHQLQHQPKVDYKKALTNKVKLLGIAYQNWIETSNPVHSADFDNFCDSNKNWLHDYALFVLIDKLEKGKPWHRWPADLKQRKAAALKKIATQHAAEIQETKWQQWIFFKQWEMLREKAMQLGVQIIGDIPFYSAHHSADVWSNPKLFALDSDGQVAAMAGVPPDYFNADGQLWGMPVYRWDAMAQQNFEWWKNRMSMNLKLYDMVRLDHFRAFDEYWEVAAGSKTAKDGSWKKGPQMAFFSALQKSLGKMPLIAEDLGEITDTVYQLRDELQLPGMKVLQFAFGADSSQSVHIPHQYLTANCVVYTGTHDNNTSRGWFDEETDQTTKKRIEEYLGVKVDRKNISHQLIKLALSSTAEIAIIPMQDILNETADGRMNVPASVDGNWTWKLTVEHYENIGEQIKPLLKLYNRT